MLPEDLRSPEWQIEKQIEKEYGLLLVDMIKHTEKMSLTQIVAFVGRDKIEQAIRTLFILSLIVLILMLVEASAMLKGLILVAGGEEAKQKPEGEAHD